MDFETIIAFVAPGFITFHALSYHMPTARALMDAASNREQSVGVFLFALLASISLGLLVSGVRALTVDNFLRANRVWRGYVVPQMNLDWSKVGHNTLPVLLIIRDGYYRHYQFYSNAFVAMAFWVVARATADGPTLSWLKWVLVASVLPALLLSARFSFVRYVNAVNDRFKT